MSFRGQQNLIFRAKLTAKAQNQSSLCGCIVTYESTAVSGVRSLALVGSSGINRKTINAYYSS